MENAVCKFCGQIQAIEINDNTSEEKLLELGTLSCNCEAARCYQRMQERADIAKVELHNMVLVDDEAHNIKAVDQSVYNLLTSAIELIAKDKIYKISLGLCSGGTVDIKSGAGGKISLKRSVALTNKREV